MKTHGIRRSFRLCVEELEARLVPATVTPPATPPVPYAVWGSTNWSGMDLDTTKGAVTAVSGSWIVPAVTGSGVAYSATWVGIDGDLSNTVEQIGTESDTLAASKADGTPQYYAWYEMYPADSYNVPVADIVKPGDQINASVVSVGQVKSGSKTNDNYLLTISDITQKWTYSTTQSVPNHQIGQRDSAEWIEEAPSGRNVLPLANFSSVTFTNAQATISSTTGTIASFVGNSSIINYGTTSAPQDINIFDMGTFKRSGQWTSIEDETSLLNGAGNSFTVQFGSSNPSPPGGTTFESPNVRPSGFENFSMIAPVPMAGITAAQQSYSLTGPTIGSSVSASPSYDLRGSAVIHPPSANVTNSGPVADRTALAVFENESSIRVPANDVSSNGTAPLPAISTGGTWDPIGAGITIGVEVPIANGELAVSDETPAPANNNPVKRSTAVIALLLGATLLAWSPPVVQAVPKDRKPFNIIY